MDLNKFVMWFRQIISEFFFLNGHFDTKENSKLSDYDIVFAKWNRDILKKYNNIGMKMHWGNSEVKIADNQVILDVFYRSVYLFEVKYKFGDDLHPSFDGIINDFKKIVAGFLKLNDFFDFSETATIEEYEKYFSASKGEFMKVFPDFIIDIIWGNKNSKINKNILYLNVLYGDIFLFQVKHAMKIENINLEEI